VAVQSLRFREGDGVGREGVELRPGDADERGHLEKIVHGERRGEAGGPRAGRAFDAAWLTARGWRGGRRAIRLPRWAALATLLDTLTPTRATWNGHNASTWREAIVAVNGFDLDMGYGGEDRALGERLTNLGYRGRRVRFRAPVLHLDHPRPYADPEVIRANRRIRDEIRRSRDVRTRRGLAEVANTPPDRSPFSPRS
jgi:hypothetical protein